MFQTIKARAAVLGFAALFGASAHAADITGAGATFIYPLISKWSADYNKATGHKVNYQSIGSGGGIAQIKAATVDFGSSDAPLKPEELAEAGLGQFPSAIGGVVPVVTVPGIGPGQLKLTGPLLADIFLGKVAKWNDPAIAALNEGLALPDSRITVVHRSDGSGTTFNFTNYLSKVSADWKTKVGENASVEWPVGIGAKGNEGVANNVANTKGAIGYVEYAYAKQNKLTYTKLVNKDGKIVEPSTESFQAAASGADWSHAAGFYEILTNEPGAKSWPITAATFILLPKEPKDEAAAAEALKFFSWAFAKGGKAAEELDYIPMPANVVALIKKSWAGVKDASGKPLAAN
jgi:phosphate transport system substrate-binding protein